MPTRRPAAQAERAEQVALPVQPARGGVGDQPPADHVPTSRARAAPAGRRRSGRGVVQVGLGVVALPQRQVGQHDPAPGGDRDAERDQEALELDEEVVGEEDDEDRAEDIMITPSITAATGRGTRRPAASRESPDE